MGGGGGGIVLEYTSFSRLVKAIIRILETFLCFSFISIYLFIYFFNLLNFYPVTRFLVTPLLVTRCCVNLFSKRRQETVSMPTIIAKISNNKTGPLSLDFNCCKNTIIWLF